METGPLTDIDINWDDPEEIREIVWFRVTTSDEEWELDAASSQWDLTREEAATRLDQEDYSSPLPF